MTSVAQLGYLGLSVNNVDEWERFATQILGLQGNGRDADGSLFLRMDEYHHRFIVHPTGKDDLAYIGWEVATEEALQAMAAQLTTAGVAVQPGTPEEAEARRVAGLLKFHDPSGIASEIFYGPLVTFDKPFQSPRPISGFKTGEQGLGHFVLAVDDFDRSLYFYREVLGLRISDFVRFSPAPGMMLNVAFFHCNPRHHSLAFWAMPQAPKRLHHFMLQLNAVDDVGSAYYLCQDQKVPIVMNLGRHTNDHMVSFYLRTPSGFAVEYGWGAREVDDRTWQVQLHTAGSIWGHQGSL
ncbi:MAG: biphenyl-2,3-diol 1,2-dioxygenase [Deltaproteobacteria bacterium]|nr:biphenyl-2,3-diol 1,2-dioxygenase [Deltaproteobacteria bacterium]